MAFVRHCGRDPITTAKQKGEPLERKQNPHYQPLGADSHFGRRTHCDRIRPRHLSVSVGKVFALSILPWDRLARDGDTSVGVRVDLEEQRIRLEARRDFPK